MVMKNKRACNGYYSDIKINSLQPSHFKFRGYNEQEVDEFLDIIVDDYEDLVHC